MLPSVAIPRLSAGWILITVLSVSIARTLNKHRIMAASGRVEKQEGEKYIKWKIETRQNGRH